MCSSRYIRKEGHLPRYLTISEYAGRYHCLDYGVMSYIKDSFSKTGVFSGGNQRLVCSMFKLKNELINCYCDCLEHVCIFGNLIFRSKSQTKIVYWRCSIAQNIFVTRFYRLTQCLNLPRVFLLIYCTLSRYAV